MFRFFGIGSNDSQADQGHDHGHDAHGHGGHSGGHDDHGHSGGHDGGHGHGGGHDAHGHSSSHGHDAHGHGHDVEVHHEDGEASDYDIGQVALDVLDTEMAYVIVAPLAGVPISEIDIAINRNVLVISGERSHPEVYNESLNILISECFFGPFSRSVILPENLAFNKISATMENNLLTITVPKLTFPTKSIKINKLES